MPPMPVEPGLFRVVARRLVCLLMLCLCVPLLVSCGSLPSLEGRTESFALPQSQARTTSLGRALSPAVQANPGKSGILALADARDAFAARALLARAAERTLDVQYYIWNDDLTGTLLLDALHDAAERGVRVRLLLDDNGIAGLDEMLAALNRHPSIEVRLFNPFMTRRFKALGYLTDFSRANRRMHNKSFTVDNQATIVGGRNIGDEYFGATEGVLFADLDVLAVGPVVQEVSRDFDRYWASGSSYPAERILPAVSADQLDALHSLASRIAQDPAAAQYIAALRAMPFVSQLLQGNLDMEWARTRMLSDDPAKGLGQADDVDMLTYGLSQILSNPVSNVELVSPYLVPAENGTAAFVDLAQRDVRIRILTNSLSATDVAAVHSGYARRRKDLLRAGIMLFEMRRMSPETGNEQENAGPFGSSGSSLHAKTFSIDGATVFVGSFNFDPRSARLNTELGFIIESPPLASRIEAAFADSIPANSYEVRLTDAGDLYWLERRGEQIIRHDTEPETSIWTRTWVRILSALPIEWLL